MNALSTAIRDKEPTVGKPLVRLYPIDINRMPWVQVRDAPAGVEEKVLALDPATGSVTRYLRARDGVEIPGDTSRWEETFVLEGSCSFGENDYPAGSYLCIRPGPRSQRVRAARDFVCFQVLDRDEKLDKPDVRLSAAEIEAMTWETASRGDLKHREKVLASDSRGSLTRILEIDPGGDTTELDDHDHNEEVLILQGACKNGEEFHPAGTYTFNPPHAIHGPFLVDEPLVCFEVKNQP